jgi:cytosine/creatinine deaminase
MREPSCGATPSWLDDDRCFDMLNQFIIDKPHLWYEDIGVAET